MAVAPDLRGSSEGSLDSLLEGLKGRLGSGADAAAVGDELLAVASLVRREGSLRRALTDPALPGEVKRRMASELVGKDLGEVARETVVSAVAQKWTSGRHLPQALEELGIHAVVTSADADHDDRRVAQELFSVRRAVHDHPSLRDALADRSRSDADKQQLVRSVLGDGAAPATVTLVQQAVVSDHRSVELALEYYQKVAAAAHDRRVAMVTVAETLSSDDAERLRKALADLYGSGVQVNTVVDPAVLGGVKVEIGDDVIDGTIASRLAEADRLVAR